VALLYPWLTVGFLLPPILYPGYPGKQKKKFKKLVPKTKKSRKNQCKTQKKKKNQYKIKKKAKVRHRHLSELFTCLYHEN